MADRSDDFLQAVQCARDQGHSLYIRGSNSKRHLVGRDCDATELDLSQHSGILDYQPGELYLCARAGTPLADIASTLAEQDQELTFEPPLFDGRGTLGGTLASNLSGPARPWGGSIRDAAIGVQLINGQGQCLNYGGKVVKNVAGYDVTRLQAGALGTLGILTEITLKVLPRPEHSLTLVFEQAAEDAVATMNRLCGEPKPLNGACWYDGHLYLRLAGAASAVNHTARQWGGEPRAGDDSVWQDLREMTLPFFQGEEPLWRFSVKSTARIPDSFGPQLIDWCGAQRWVRGEQDVDALQAEAARAGSHVSLFRGGDRSGEVRPALSRLEQQLQQRIKSAFDPDGLFNPGRLYSWM